jgi:hypothetical protein
MDHRRAPLTVACVYVRGPYRFTADYVVRLWRMVRRHAPRPFDFVCLVDIETEHEVRAAMAEAGASVLLWRVQSLKGLVPDNGVGYWQKVRLFDPDLGFTGRVLYLDLDTWIVAPLAPIIDVPAMFALTEDALVTERAHLNRDRDGRALIRRFNSSVMVWEPGPAMAALWHTWSPDVAARLSTDQDWIGEQRPDARALHLEWFPRISQLLSDPAIAAAGGPLPPEARVVLVKKPKNAAVAAAYPWFDRAWGAPA